MNKHIASLFTIISYSNTAELPFSQEIKCGRLNNSYGLGVGRGETALPVLLPTTFALDAKEAEADIATLPGPAAAIAAVVPEGGGGVVDLEGGRGLVDGDV